MTNRIELWKGLVGSRLYGCSREDSDFDIRSIYTLSAKELLNPFKNEKQITRQNKEEDDVAYELSFFFCLAAQCNPNILELLFVPEDPKYTYSMHPAFKLVRDNRHLFLSKELFYRFTGYMKSQIHRLHNHAAWFKNPPDKHPKREDYFIPSCLTNEYLAQIVNFPPEIIVDEYRKYIDNWRQYLEDKKRYQVYQVWLKERNPKRAALEKAYGYDTKFASHAVRLAFETKELLINGNITFPLINAKDLLDIKNGLWTIEEVLNFADTAYASLEKVMQLSTLPRHADRDKLADLYFKVLETSGANA